MRTSIQHYTEYKKHSVSYNITPTSQTFSSQTAYDPYLHYLILKAASMLLSEIKIHL